MSLDFDRIYLGGKNGPMASGKFKLSEAGLGWKNSVTNQIITVSADDILKFHWIRVARGYEVRITKKNTHILKFDGFPKDAFDSLASTMNRFYRKTLEPKEISTRGYNWGQAEFQNSMLSFSVHNKEAFEIPLTDVVNTTVSGKNEVLVEFNAPKSVNPKERTREDSLVEIRFYIPGNVTEGQIFEDGEKTLLKDRQTGEEPDEEEEGAEAGEISAAAQKVATDQDGEALSAATLFCDTIKEKSDINAALSEMIVSFDELLCLTPRSRFQVDMHADFFRLRGKTHDYKILYTSVTKLFLVPKPDDLHWNFIVGIHPPLRQGQTRYPYLVFQFERETEIDLNLNITDEVMEEKYAGRLEKHYDGQLFQVTSDIFQGLVGKRVATPSQSYRSAQGYHGVKCSQKANEAILYPLEKAFISVPKPPIYIPFVEISAVTFSRISSVTGTTKTFEVKFSLTSGLEYSFSSISREEHGPLESFCRSKKLSIHNEIADESSYRDFDDEGGRRAGSNTIIDYRDDMDDSESEDEDFIADKSGSDVDEEFNENYSSSSGEEDDERKSSKEKEDDGSSSVGTPKSVVPSKSKPKSDDGAPKKRVAKAKKEGPKRPMTSFLFFSREHRAKLREKDPTMTLGEIGKALGALWKDVTSAEKSVRYSSLIYRNSKLWPRKIPNDINESSKNSRMQEV
ncbi:hypothetical protein BC833DRAFT_608471 [Globomyces pollinis-pini]|nr:hypothetical protein BC833DRAFT_608471 [Globomyces pollinis-pini]